MCTLSQLSDISEQMVKCYRVVYGADITDIFYRLNSAKERLESAELLLKSGKYKDSVGRSYYAVFSAMRAVLAKDKVDFSKHAGVSQ